MSSNLSSLGVGSGLDLETLVSSLVRTERQVLEAPLIRGGTLAQTRLSALGTLKSAVAGLATAVNALRDFQVGLTAASSDGARLAVGVGTAASAGTFQVRISELASAQSLASAVFADQDSPLGSGELTLSVGGESVTLSLDASNSSLGQVRDAINASGLGVQAVVVRDGEQFRLLLTSGQAGTQGEMTLAATGSVDTRLDSAAMEVTAPARNAAFSVNGLALSSSSNTIDDVIPGIALTLNGLTEGAEVIAVTVSADRQGVRTKIDALVRAFNTLVDNIGTAGRADPEGRNSGPLVGDSTLRAIQSRVGGAFSARFDTGVPDAAFNALLDIGLSTDISGRAQLDAERLAAALGQDQAGVESLVAAFANSLGTALDGFSGAGGILDTRRNNLNAELRRIGQQREAVDQRMEQVEARLRTQFSALDSLLAQFQNTSSFLTQQLANLSNLTLAGRR